MYLTVLTLCLLLLPLGAPQLTGTLGTCEMVVNLSNENPSENNHGCINGSMLQDLQKELKKSQEDMKLEFRSAQDKLKLAQDELKQAQDELKQAQLQHRQQEEMHFQQIYELLSQNCGSSPPKGSFHNPAPSCKSVPQNSSSGKYWIQSITTSFASHEYCDLNNTWCGTRGWMRVADLDMTDTTQKCPAGFRHASGSGYRGCGTHGRGCVSTTFPVHGVQYSKLCGRINAYQYYSPNAFAPYYQNRTLTVDSRYVDGVSLTHGQYPRKHIWTFAAALDETRSDHDVCPCTKTTTPYSGAVPPFIGEDYFCETGSRYTRADRVYTADPLWDGRGCGTSSATQTTCCSFNNPPWFCKTLSQPTTDDIELRSCVSGLIDREDVLLKLVEIYIQ